MVLNVNGVKREVTVDPDVALLTVLRDHLDLTGSKYGCGEGACGACTVLINDNPTRSCIHTCWQRNKQRNHQRSKALKKMENFIRFRKRFLKQMLFNVPIVRRA